MRYYLFTRIITKKVAINKYGKLGYEDHKEAILLMAETEEQAYEKLAPFNYKKHIKFKFEGTLEGLPEEDLQYFVFNEIVDLGNVKDL